MPLVELGTYVWPCYAGHVVSGKKLSDYANYYYASRLEKENPLNCHATNHSVPTIIPWYVNECHVGNFIKRDRTLAYNRLMILFPEVRADGCLGFVMNSDALIWDRDGL